MRLKHTHKQHKGQSLVEFALVLPFLILLFIGLVEAGYAMYDYLVIANANREGVRLAARGRFTDEHIVERIIGAGGYRDIDGASEPLLRTEGDNPNAGMIITHIPLPADVDSNWHQKITVKACCDPDCPDPDPSKINVTQCLKGVVAEGGTTRDIKSSDSVITDVTVYQNSAEATELINQLRLDEDYEPKQNVIVVVETFVAHPTLLHLPTYFPVDDPLRLYFKSTMRVTLNSRNQMGP